MIDESHDNPYHNVFVQSLEYVTADDLGAPPKKKKKDPVDVIIELFRKAIFWAAVVAFFVSGYQIVAKLYSYHQADEIYGGFENIFDMTDRREDLVAYAIRSSAMSTLTPVNGTKEESDTNANAGYDTQFNEKLMIVQGQLQLLRNENKDVVGWIEMPGDTKINYPVVQGEDNDYYLHYAYNGAYNPAGSIYLDYRNSVSVSTNRHTVIYGHNMESGSPMFANLLHFQDESYWKNNRYIHIYTDEAMYTYEVFAAYETSPQLAGVENHSWRMNFNKDEKLFLQWVDSVRARSDISPKVTIEGNSRILTLSTCMNVNENRYVVHAVLAEVSK
jgi:SrtB family sortase